MSINIIPIVVKTRSCACIFFYFSKKMGRSGDGKQNILLGWPRFKMIGMLLNVVHSQVQKRQQKHITKEVNGFHKVTLLAEAALSVSQVNGTPLFVRKCLKRWLAQGSS